MNPNLDTHAPTLRTLHILLQSNIPPIFPQSRPRRNNQIPDQLPLVHERRSQCLGAGPRLRAAAVEVDTLHGRGGEGGGAGELKGAVGTELEDGGRLRPCCGDCEVFSPGLHVSLSHRNGRNDEPLSRANWFLLNSLARIIGVQHRSTP